MTMTIMISTAAMFNSQSSTATNFLSSNVGIRFDT